MKKLNQVEEKGFRLLTGMRTALAALPLLLLGTVACMGAEDAKPASTEGKAYALRLSGGADTVKSLGWHRLATRYAQKGVNPIVIDAVASTMVNLGADDKAPLADAEAFGGLCVVNVCELVNRISIETPGEYDVWYRAYFPVKGNWNHKEALDDGEPVPVTDSQNGPDKQWLWTKGATYNLTKGEHLHMLPRPAAWCGGARLNRIVFAPKGSPAPEGQGPDGALCDKRMPKTAALVSNRINLEEMSSWKLEFEAEDNGGKIDVKLSFDRGHSWRPVEKGKTYEVTPETKRVMFKFRLTAGAAAGSQSPRLRKPALMEIPGRHNTATR